MATVIELTMLTVLELCHTRAMTELVPIQHFATAPASGMAEPTTTGRFGEFGGRFVPESIVPACMAVEEAFRSAWVDPEFRRNLDRLLAVHAGLAAVRRTWHYAATQA